MTMMMILQLVVEGLVEQVVEQLVVESLVEEVMEQVVVDGLGVPPDTLGGMAGIITATTRFEPIYAAQKILIKQTMAMIKQTSSVALHLVALLFHAYE